MLSLVLSLSLLAAPAAAPEKKAPESAAKAEAKAEAKADPAKKVPEPAKAEPDAKAVPARPFPKDGHDHDHAHDHDKDGKEPPLDEASQKVVKISDALLAMTRESIGAYREMVTLAKESKDCEATAKAIAARNKKHDAEVAKKKAAADALRKGVPQGDQQAAAGKALFGLTDEMHKLRASFTEDTNAVLAFKGQCPKQGAAVERTVDAMRKRFAPN